MNKANRSTLRVLICCSVLVVVALRAHSAAGEADTPIAVTGVRIVTGTGETIESGTILMSHGRIIAVGTEVDVPAHARLIDGTGLIAYPGFVDALSHVGIADKSRTQEQRRRVEDVNPDPRQGALAATRFANRRGILPERRAIDLYAPDEDELDKLREAGFTAAHIAPRGGILGGTSDLVSLSDEPIRRTLLAADLVMHASFSAGEPGKYPQTLLGAIAQFRQVMLDAARHVKLAKWHARHPYADSRLPVDAALDALVEVLSRKQEVLFAANSDRAIRRALDLAAEFELDVAISGGKEAWRVVDRIRLERVPLIVSLEFDEEPEYGKKKGDEPAETEEDAEPDPDAESAEKAEKSEDAKKKDEVIYEPLKVRKERRRLWEEQVANVVRLHEAGVPFALTTDGSKDPAAFRKSLRLVIERGLPEEAALAALTTVPADMFGVADQSGTIAVGKIASFSLMTGGLGDKKTKTRYVFVDGNKFEYNRDDDEKEKRRKDKKHDDEGQSPDRAESASDTPAGAQDEPEVAPDAELETAPEQDADANDKGPTFATEIKADRFPKTRTGGNVLIANATVIPVTSDTMQRASILVRDGKIAEIGPDLVAPDGVLVIDATGRFVIPGLVDCHSHLAIDGVNEGSLSITAEVRVGDTINPTSVAIYRAAAGGTTTHHAMHGSANAIGGQNVIFKLKYDAPIAEMLIADAPRTIKFALGENVKQSNWANAWGKRYPNTRMGIEATIRSALEAATRYQKEWDLYEWHCRVSWADSAQTFG